ncbi:ThuA domain-containing protein [Parapedobacter lycopersici]|uniref:ThuA domain-containing protein n=1 Tax=Parapedobacter lycopersici TaxID=1864939 RepID=UPI00214D5CD9|nr:ThuA domain-containing protein [Parapedobacter lycopersici]
MNKHLSRSITLLCIYLMIALIGYAQERPKVLVFSKTLGYRHANIEAAAAVIRQLGQQHGFDVDHSEDVSLFTDEGLQPYQALIFLSTSGNLFNADQQAAFQRYIRKGKGLVGIHAASTTAYEWPWYGKLIGGYFDRHPAVQYADILVIDDKHPATRHLPTVWHREDEWYDFREMNSDVKLLLKLDENSYQGGGMGANHPIAWYHEYEGGRVFYTALGHTEASFEDPVFQQHIVGGIWYAIQGDLATGSKN